MMKKWHKRGYLSVLVCLMLILNGCATASAASFCSLDGLSVTATTDWFMVNNPAVLFEEAFVSDVDNGVDLAISDKKGRYFSIERYNCQEQLNDLVRLADMLRQQLAVLGEEGLRQQLTSQGIDEEALLQYEALWQCPVGEEAVVYRLLADAAWQKQMAIAAQDYVVLGKEDVTLLGVQTILYEYSYTNNSNKAIHGYEASVIWKDKLYNFGAWTSEKRFEKSREALKAIILSAMPTAQ